jgi:hypothetical protein
MMSRIVPSITTPARGSCSNYKRLTSIRSSWQHRQIVMPPAVGLDGQNKVSQSPNKSPAAGEALSLKFEEEPLTRWGRAGFALAFRHSPGIPGQRAVFAAQTSRYTGSGKLERAFAHAVHAARQSAHRTACSAQRS